MHHSDELHMRGTEHRDSKEIAQNVAKAEKESESVRELKKCEW